MNNTKSKMKIKTEKLENKRDPDEVVNAKEKPKRKIKTEKLETEDEEEEATNVKQSTQSNSKRRIKTKQPEIKSEPNDEDEINVKQIKRKLSEDEDDHDTKQEVKKLKGSNKSVKPSTSHGTIKEEVNDNLWDDYELLVETQNLNENVAKVLIRLFEEGNTIPFIARYRKDVTGNLNPDQLRDIKEEYDNICTLKLRSQTVLKNIDKTGNLNSLLEKSILSARTVEELEHIYAPYKPGTKRSLAERAKALGLEKPALDLLNNCQWVNPEAYVDKKNKELETINDVEKGFMHIIASAIATDTDVLALLRKLRTETNFFIECKRSNTKKNATTTKPTKASKSAKANIKGKLKNVDEEKFSTYFDFKISQKFIKPHQVLAINRGEALKVLSVKVVVPDFVFNRFSNFCAYRWINKGSFNHIRKRILEMSVKDSYTRLVQPYIVREVRSELKSKAEKASYEVFSTNLKQLLLMPPLKGRRILGIDPGYLNGCKMAVISEIGSVLANAVIYPHKNKTDRDVNILKNMLKDHNCSLIALGNGTACRETEAWLSDLLQNNTFAPLDVTYTIVNESGASIYSCSAEAKKEFSSLDPNIISAISLARRVQEPLAELVKVEPKHLGVGMYQHDLPKKQLEQALDEVVMECVSFVGVDLNTASQCLLKHVAGLTEKRAAQIIEYREKKGSFVSRKQLKEVKGIGPRIFEQCAGFLRVGPVTSNQSNEFYKNGSTNRLDCTYIHPESYDVTLKILKKLNLNLDEIGQQSLINSVKLKIPQLNIAEFSSSLGSSVETINLILEALSKPLNFDLRSDCTQKPLFKKGLTSIYDLKVGCSVTGSVTNITHFGCFVDIGVGQDGLIHQSKLNGFNLQIGDKVEVKVINLEIDRKRISLQMMNKL